MSVIQNLFGSSLGKKYLMAISGFVLVGFSFGHMLGNLQIFMHPDQINTYAHQLQSLPYGLLWVVRLTLLAAVIIHIWTAIVLSIENRRARPTRYNAEDTRVASYASRTMIWSGLIIFGFIIFHLLHYTTRSIYDYDAVLRDYTLDGVAEPALNVYAMMYLGFAKWPVSLFYIISVFLLSFHLGHGISSMFQSLGLRNHIWRRRLDRAALVLAWVLFIGFASIPIAVMLDAHAGIPIFDTASFEKVLTEAAPETLIPEGN